MATGSDRSRCDPLRSALMLETFSLTALGIVTGAIGSALGLGGGFILVTVFHTIMGWPLIAAVAGSQVCLLAGSLAATYRYLRMGLVDLRLGVLLETPAIAGSLIGAVVAYLLGAKVLTILFGMVALAAAYYMWRDREGSSGEIPSADPPRRVPLAMALSVLAGSVASVLGVGGGVLKVPIMSVVMGLPMRRVVATSSFMIGITAAASALVYHAKGSLWIAPSATVALGVLIGSEIGARLQPRVGTRSLRRIFSGLLLVFALRMVWFVFLKP